jgi:hypothetical protein
LSSPLNRALFFQWYHPRLGQHIEVREEGGEERDKPVFKTERNKKTHGQSGL